HLLSSAICCSYRGSTNPNSHCLPNRKANSSRPRRPLALSSLKTIKARSRTSSCTETRETKGRCAKTNRNNSVFALSASREFSCGFLLRHSRFTQDVGDNETSQTHQTRVADS